MKKRCEANFAEQPLIYPPDARDDSQRVHHPLRDGSHTKAMIKAGMVCGGIHKIGESGLMNVSQPLNYRAV